MCVHVSMLGLCVHFAMSRGCVRSTGIGKAKHDMALALDKISFINGNYRRIVVELVSVTFEVKPHLPSKFRTMQQKTSKEMH
jgi:hypothetical protein